MKYYVIGHISCFQSLFCFPRFEWYCAVVRTGVQCEIAKLLKPGHVPSEPYLLPVTGIT